MVLHGNMGERVQERADGSCNLRRPPQEVAASHYSKWKDPYGRRENSVNLFTDSSQSVCNKEHKISFLQQTYAHNCTDTYHFVA